MSVNKYSTTDGLVTLANGSRMWVGTQAAHDAAKQAGTLPNNCLIAITDDASESMLSSNPNLLDNPWFAVNQRGQNSYTALSTINTYTVDRWRLEVAGDSHHSVTVNNDGSLTVTNTHSTDLLYFSQPALKKDFLVDEGTEYVASVDVVNYSGTIYVDVGLMDMSPWSRFANGTIYSTGINVFKGAVPSNWGGTVSSFRPICFILDRGASMTIRKVKLERGAISTLTLDAMPNYQQELVKCQRFFQRIGKTKPTTGAVGKQMTIGLPHATTAIWFPIYLSAPMRVTPSITNTAGTWIITASSTAAAVITDPPLRIVGLGETDTSIINIACDAVTGDPFTIGQPYKLSTKAELAAGYLDLSADL